MKAKIASGVLVVIVLGISWAQTPAQAAGVAWGTTVAYADPQGFDNFAWDDPVMPADGVGDSPLVP